MQLLVLDADEPLDRYVSSALLATDHDVTTCTTIAGLIEALMRGGERFEVIVINTARNAELMNDAARYAHWYAPAASLVALDDAHIPGLALPFPIRVSTVLDLPAAAGKLPAL